MSFETLYPSAANLIGNVTIPRNVNPMIRSGLRRTNPDLTSSVPYYPSASGKTLRINYTKEVATVVTPATVDVVLTGNGLVSIISDINAADTTNVKALDLDGFLAIQNLNAGKTHLITIAPFTTTPANDAAPVLGFVVDPFPGSTSYAGEISSSPGSKSQLNPQTTALLSKDDALGSGELNRGFVSVLQLVENLRAELARDVMVFKDITLTFTTHAGDGRLAARVNDDNIRLFYPEVANPASTSDLNTYYRVLNTSNEEDFHGTFDGTEQDATGAAVNDLHYATTGTPFNVLSVFSTWGTPDGGTVISTTTVNKDKHPSTAVTSISGNIVRCASATFITKKIKAGDPVQFTASNLQPFDHSGWFAVDAVIDETHLAIRPMAKSEQTPAPSGIKPRFLNPAAGGTLRVAMGRFIPAGDIYIKLNTGVSGTTYVIRSAVGIPFINTLTDERVCRLSGSLNKLAQIISAHIHSSTAHKARNIVLESVSGWVDSTGLVATTVQAGIQEILSDLSSTASGISGYRKIGVDAVSIGGSAPSTLGGVSIRDQIVELLTDLRDHINQTSSGAHFASAISYSGGVAWADGTTNPSTTVEAQLDKILSDLSPSTGSAKIGGAASGTDIAAGTLAAQVSNLAVNWLKMSRANTISGLQTFSALLTASVGILVGNNKNIKLVGTGRYGHDNITLPLAAVFFNPQNGTFVTSGILSHWETTSGVGTLYSGLALPEGTRIRSFVAWHRKNGFNNSSTVTLTRVSLNTSDFTDTASTVGSTSDTGTSFNLSTSSSGSLDHTIDPAFTYFFTVSLPREGIHFLGVQVIFDFPVTVP